jgi:hypothetical protein
MAPARKPVFFTSVPKCGKNLIYSFYFALGMKRWDWGDRPALLHAAHFGRITDKPSYGFPAADPVSEGAERAALDDVMGQLTSMPADIISHHHFLPHPRLTRHIHEQGLSTVFVARDPRDVLVSMLNFARKRQLPSHVSAILEPLSDEDALLLLVEGRDRLIPFADYFDAYRDWLSAPGVTQLRFEDLIGPKGGGDAARQEQACMMLAALAGLPPTDDAVKAATQQVFNTKAGTFHKGAIGAWREAFTPSVTRAYDRHAGWLGPRWGYT